MVYCQICHSIHFCTRWSNKIDCRNLTILSCCYHLLPIDSISSSKRTRIRELRIKSAIRNYGCYKIHSQKKKWVCRFSFGVWVNLACTSARLSRIGSKLIHMSHLSKQSNFVAWDTSKAPNYSAFDWLILPNNQHLWKWLRYGTKLCLNNSLTHLTLVSIIGAIFFLNSIKETFEKKFLTQTPGSMYEKLLNLSKVSKLK